LSNTDHTTPLTPGRVKESIDDRGESRPETDTGASEYGHVQRS